MSSNAMFEPMPASAIRAMLAGQVLLMALHVMRLPIWLTGCVTLLVLWSYMARTGRWRLPGRLLRLVVTIGLTAGFIIQFRGQFSVDAAAAFFVLTQALKWLELRTRRDAIVLIMIQLYLAAVGFLFDQALLDAALTFSAVAVLLWALNLLQAPDVAQARQLFWGVAKLMLMLSPLVIVLFVLFPRLAPLWSVPLVSNQASSGLSDSMAPGDFNKLVQRSERVFRATFNGPLPPPSARYWRALHLDHFDGRTWSNVEEPPPRRHSRLPVESEATPLKAGEYEILQEPSYQRWAFLLKGSVPLASEMLLNEYGLLRHARPLDTLVRYRLRAASYSGADRLSWADHERLTRIPPGGNPRTRRWIEGLRASEA
ncbi:MAG: DUF3488 domain-containing protein, partial [Gammaproteobacteria bacterium]|nr:DUF3488 domain-containing protein [Gammaproteobacteria bacterium]